MTKPSCHAMDTIRTIRHHSMCRRTPILVKEGEEDVPFWNALGGEEEYYRGPVDQVIYQLLS